MQKRNNEIKNTILATADTEQYDASAKKIIGQKCILAEILVETAQEFHGMDPKEVEKFIEGEPFIGNIPVEPGLTNSREKLKETGSKIVGLNSENQEENEGLIRFDIVFYVRCRDGVRQIIINIEIQKDEPGEYDILNRAIFYISRMIASQKERDFVKSKYNNIKPVYSIWICMNMNENSMTHIHLVADEVFQKCKVSKYKNKTESNRLCRWKGNLDLINIVMIGLENKITDKKDEYRLHRLLETIFSNELPEKEKLNILREEYSIFPDEEMKKEMNEMCNLGQGILERGIEQGIEQGEEQKNHMLAEMMIQDGEPIEKIKKYTGYALEYIQQIALEMGKTIK